MTDKRLKDEMRELAKSKSDALNLISGILGINIGGQPTVEISSREGFVWVRLRGNTSELIQAYNGSVSPIFGLPVLVTRSGNKYSIVGRDVEKYDNWGESSYLPKHGTQHSFAPELGFGGDVTWIYSRQFVPLSAVPSGSAGAGSVIINSYVYRSPGDGAWKFLGDVGSPVATGLNPTGTSARMLLLCVNADTNLPLFITGTTFFSSSLTGTASIAPYIPPMNNNHFLPISAIRLVSGTDVIGWDNIYDMRQFSVTTPVPFVGGLMVRDEGVDVGTGSIINFVGAGVNAVVSGDTITVSVTGSTVEIQDEGVSQGSVSALNFVGNNVDAMVIGSTARIFITGSTGAGTTAIQDEGVPKGDVLTFNFVGGNVDASVSGTVVRVFVTGSSGGSVSTGAIQSYGDTQWLRLDTTNDNAFNNAFRGNLYFTGTSTFQGNLGAIRPGQNALFVEGNEVILASGTATSLDITNYNKGIVGSFVQYPQNNATMDQPLLYLWRGTDDNYVPNITAPLIAAETFDASGTASGGFLNYVLNNTNRITMNPSASSGLTGTAYLLDTEKALQYFDNILVVAGSGTPYFSVKGNGAIDSFADGSNNFLANNITRFSWRGIASFTSGTSRAVIAEQDVQDEVVNYPALLAGRYAVAPENAPTYNTPVILAESYAESGTTVGGAFQYDLNGTVRTDINPSQVGTGTAVLFDTEATLSHHGKLLMLENAGTPKFWVNASGTAFERNTPLAKESGAYGTFTTVDGKTVTVRAGIIVSIV